MDIRGAEGGLGATLAADRDAALDRLADAVEAALDMDELRRIVGLDAPRKDVV